MARNPSDIDHQIEEAKQRLAALDTERDDILKQIEALQRKRESAIRASSLHDFPEAPVRQDSSSMEKVALFKSLFRGREDVYPRRWENYKTGRSGYQPACNNEWVRGKCDKRKTKCGDCLHRELLPVTEEVIRNHLLGENPDEKPYRGARRDFTVGVYPLLEDETCWFLAADFDKATWQEDVNAFLETCETYNVPAALERSRSGKGGHVWIFFSEQIPAILPRKMGSFLLTETMERRPEIGFDSYDRFFPNQDTMPQGGFGNLIALPLQKRPREQENSVFVDKEFAPYEDQWAFLSSLRRMKRGEVEAIVDEAQRRGRILGVRMVPIDEHEDQPWSAPPSRRPKELHLTEPLPECVHLVLGNQIYIERDGLPPALTNRLVRLAAFQNPEFYRAQAMRLSTFGKPRIISCAEDFSKHIGLPRGCLNEVTDFFESLEIQYDIVDERVAGEKIKVRFNGELSREQKIAAKKMVEQDTGVLAATTAFGKTVVAAYVLAKRAVNTLVLVHRRQLLDQWIERLSCFLNLEPKKIGQIGAGKRRPSGFIDVALIQSLVRKNVVDDIVGQYGYLIVDECHHISAVSFEKVARQCKARYVNGLSATAIRKDGHHPIIFMQCGPILHRVDDKKQAELRPFEHRVIVRKTDFRVEKNDDDEKDPPIHTIYAAIVEDKNRNDKIFNDVVQAVESGRSPVLLTERKKHLDYFSERFSEVYDNVIVLKGGMGVKQRREVMERMSNIDMARSTRNLWHIINSSVRDVDFAGLAPKARRWAAEKAGESEDDERYPVNSFTGQAGLRAGKTKSRKSKKRDIRLPPAGTVIRKKYKGREYAVEVLENGFVYEGCHYKSLSAIANEITGSHWNGFAFFGLKHQQKSKINIQNDPVTEIRFMNNYDLLA